MNDESVIWKKLYYCRRPHGYSPQIGCSEVVWHEDLFMPFTVIKGVDSCPPDYHNYKRNRKTHWWVYPNTAKTLVCRLPDVSDMKEFTDLDKAIEYCFKQRDKWLKRQIKMTKSH